MDKSPLLAGQRDGSIALPALQKLLQLAYSDSTDKQLEVCAFNSVLGEDIGSRERGREYSPWPCAFTGLGALGFQSVELLVHKAGVEMATSCTESVDTTDSSVVCTAVQGFPAPEMTKGTNTSRVSLLRELECVLHTQLVTATPVPASVGMPAGASAFRRPRANTG